MSSMGIVDHIDQMLSEEGTLHSTSKGLQYSYQCPICDDHKQRLFVNIDRKVVHCHNCQYSASLITFLSDVNHIPWKDALKIFRGYVSYEQQLPESLEQEIYEKLFKGTEVQQQRYIYPLPEEFILIENARGKAGQRAWNYLKGRGLTIDDCMRYYIGYCAEGHFANRIIMTDFEDGELVYWQARTWLPTPSNPGLKKLFRKAMNPSLTEEQVEQGVIAIDKSEVISNIDFIKEMGMAVVCEGRMDAYTLGDVGACTHGKSMSDEQLMKLVLNKDKIQTIAIMYDGDAFASTLATAKRLYKYFDEVLVCKLPHDQDPNSLGRKGCLEIIEQALPYSSMFEVKAKLKGWI